jgi:threonine dehydrogenase-like Zn-dependent dehydrogenase
MKLPYIYGPGDLRVIDVQRPTAGPRDLVLKVATAGICGSDFGMFQIGGVVGPAPEPFPLGHELSGTVVEAGEEVASFAIGDRVILNPLRNMVGNGGPEGGFTDYLLIRDVVGIPDAVLPIPDAMSFETGALVEPVAVGIHAVNRSGAQAGEKIAVFGAGPIGLGVVLVLKARGIDDIVVFDLSPFRRERALALGARAAFDPRETPVIEALGDLHGKETLWGFIPAVGTDRYIEASGAPGVIPEIIAAARLNATLAVVSVQKKPIEIDFMALLGKEMTITTAVGYPTELPDSIALLCDHGETATAMVSHRLPGDDFEAAWAVAAKPGEAAKVLLEYGV